MILLRNTIVKRSDHTSEHASGGALCAAWRSTLHGNWFCDYFTPFCGARHKNPPLSPSTASGQSARSQRWTRPTSTTTTDIAATKITRMKNTKQHRRGLGRNRGSRRTPTAQPSSADTEQTGGGRENELRGVAWSP